MPILNWLTREENIRTAQRVPYRLLEEVSDLSAGDDGEGNLLIQGDNLEALKALLPFYAGRVKCIYIDPPYNTRSAFEHYDDNLEHTQWLAMMWPRLELLRDLLTEDGSIWVSIDDNEAHYLKVIMDEIFGRKNFINSVTFKQSSVSGPKTINPGMVTIASYVIGFANRKASWRPKHVRRGRERDPRYSQFIIGDMTTETEWEFSTVLKEFAKAHGMKLNQLKSYLGDDYEEELHRFVIKNRDRVVQRVRIQDQDAGEAGRVALAKSRKAPGVVFSARRDDGGFNFYIEGKQLAFYKNKVADVGGQLVTGEPISDIWDDILANNSHNEGGVAFDGGKKPEALIQRIFELTTEPGELVLDSFLGSGTTAAVAQKMGRRYIGIEMGEHARTHCAPRLEKVIEGEQGGISKAVNWEGGGGFRFLRLGPPVFDEEGHIRQDIRFAVLAAHVWFSETDRPWDGSGDSPLLGIHNGHAHALLYNGILGDKRPGGGNVLTRATLALIREEITKVAPDFDGPLTVYGEQSRLTPTTLDRESITFKQTPYDVKARA
ncbi:site-specific DNA-methyltransferase [Halomonas sp. G15]|uniref:site-specific DNA-methyltransferase n=1 Tax=Halomonas sp. G15 TaxID=2903521 RepID=UPI001E3654A3|nr:site-specific DNA-methyltransferase [Halomonas sp. G15]MCE0732461.1 site-specific DNA-methyltransferase [Halomonas sp. G15]